MANCGDIIAETLINVINDEYGRKAAKTGEHMACITKDALATALHSSYKYVTEVSMVKKAQESYWPPAETLVELGAFHNAAEKGIADLYAHFSGKRTLGVLVQYDGNQIIWWMPRLVKEYTKILKKGALDQLSVEVKNAIKKNKGDPNSWVTTGEAFGIAASKVDAKELDSNKVYVTAREMSPQLQIGQRLNISHRGTTTVGSARLSAMLQTLVKFTNVDDYTHLGLPKQLLDIVKQIEGYFSLELNDRQKAEIRTKGVISIDIADMELNVSSDEFNKNKFDFKYLKPALKEAILKMEKRGMFAQAIKCSGTEEEIMNQSAALVLETVESVVKGAKITKRPPRQKIKEEAKKILRKSKGSICPTTKKGKKVLTGIKSNEPKVSEAQRQAALKAERRLDSDLMMFINNHLAKYIEPHMGRDGRLTWRTGTFAGSATVDIARTPKARKIQVIHHYEGRPYGVFDPIVGAPPWRTPARDPNALIRTAIKDIMAEKQISKFDYTLAQGKFTYNLGESDE